MILTLNYNDFTDIRVLSLINFHKDSIEIIKRSGNKRLNASYNLTEDDIEVIIDESNITIEDCKALIMLLFSFEVENEVKVD